MVGGYALAAHGHPRYTGDMDFWVRPRPDDLLRLLAGVHLNIIGLEDFKASKRASGRHKDLADLASLEPPADTG